MSAPLRSELLVALMLASVTQRAWGQETEPGSAPDIESAPETDPAFSARAVASTASVGAATLPAALAAATPGALGEPARALLDLPGVSRAAFDSGELVIWGSPAADQRIYVDGIEIPALFHPGGFRATVPAALLSAVSLTPGAASAEFGRGLGGVIELESRAQLDPDYRAQLSVDFIEAQLAGAGALGPVHAFWSGRVGYLDRLQAWLSPESRAIVPLPGSADGAARIGVELGPSALLSATWLGSHDSYRTGSADRYRFQSRDFQIAWLRYARTFGDGAEVVIAPFAGVHSYAQGGRFGRSSALLAVDEVRYGLRAHYALRRGIVALRLGFDGFGARSALRREGTLTLPAREGDRVVFDQPPGDELAEDRWSTHDVNVAPYAEVGVRLGPFTLTPGLRLETYALETSRRTPRAGDTPAIGASALFVRPEPRMLARAVIAPWLAFGARGGLHHQPPPADARSAVFGNPQLGLSRSAVIATGPVFALAGLFELEVVGFYRWMDGLVVRSRDNPPPLAALLVQEGSGRSYGLQARFERRAQDGLSADLSYTLSRSVRDDGAGDERPFDGDRTHVLSALLGYGFAGLTVGVRARFATGAPFTPVTGSYADIRDDRYEPLFAGTEARLPAFFALDLHVEQAFAGTGFEAALYLDVLNATDQRNVEDVTYTYDYAAREDITGLPVLVVVGARLTL